MTGARSFVEAKNEKVGRWEKECQGWFELGSPASTPAQTHHLRHALPHRFSPPPVWSSSPAPPPPPPPSSDPFVPSILHTKSRDDLTHLLSSPQLLDALFASTHPHAQQHEATLTAALHRNADLAARLSALEPRLHTARDGAERALLDARMKEREWRAREKEMYQSLQPFSSPALYSRLVNAVADAEAVAEAMAESFLEEGGGDGRDVGEFVREYRALRKTYHLRRERKESEVLSGVFGRATSRKPRE
ncbi:uncharacterized protein LAJ45_02698 [Morchella importuna]|uniref:uncharacterized protein n=1 Tax=Morchella importuna TaxID=1174673 RepID=UPI001E8D7C01|nr:uncharacterized protein LAJ45_02698 [Morchella importuna]KAH8153111.1 hypothetical protein LAJ45_02698 [Morchella importuna]